MKTPYLIQRAKFITDDERKYVEDRKGVDKVLSFDYMGSAEFEFGALPQSLKRIRQNLSEYGFCQIVLQKHPSKTISVFGKVNDFDEIESTLQALVDGKFLLKQHCDFSKWVKDEINLYLNSDAWWDIENDFFFWKPRKEIDALLVEGIKGEESQSK